MQWPPHEDDFAPLRETLAWVYANSPYYRRVWETARVDPSQLRSYAEFRERLPRTSKTDLVTNQKAHPPFGEFLAVPREKFGSLHTSPGPLFIPRLAEERGGTPVLKEAIKSMGVKPGDIAHITLSYHIMPGGLRLHRAFEEAGCLVINGGTGNSEMQVEVARAWRATVYAGTPSFLANLADTAKKMGLDPRKDLSYRVGFSTAEALTPQLRREMHDTLGIELFDHCGEAQIGPLAGECHVHEGMHLHARDLFCEFLDPESGEPAEMGGIGEIVATQLGPRALPLVRYAPGDAFRLLKDPCPCGDPSLRIVFVGQVGVIRKIKGVLVHPAQVYKVTSQHPELGRFQIVVDHPDGTRYDRAVLRVGTKLPVAEPEKLRQALAAQIKSNVLIQMEIELVDEAEIPEAAGAPRFAQTMVDLRHK